MIWTFDARHRQTPGLGNATPKAFANVSPGLSLHSDNPGSSHARYELNPERVRRERNPFRVDFLLIISIPELSLRSNSGLKLANAFGVLSQTQRWSNQNACASAGCGRRSRTFIFGVKIRGVTGYTIPHCWLTRRGSNAHLTA